jgi:hypothetical protein
MVISEAETAGSLSLRFERMSPAKPLRTMPELPTPIRRVGAEPVIERDRGRGQRRDEQLLAFPTVGLSGGGAVPKVN